MTRFIMAGLLAVSCVFPTRALAETPAAGSTAEAMVALRFIDLDFRGNKGQVMEYDGKYYKGVWGDAAVSNQGTEGLFDLSVNGIGSTEETAALNVDTKGGFRADGKFQNIHHRLNFFRVGEIQHGVWVPKVNIQPRAGAGDDNIMRRTESEINLGFVSPENSARFFNFQYWMVDKLGMRAWSWTGNPNIQTGAVAVNNSKRDITLAGGTNIKEDGAWSVDVLRSEFEDLAPKLASLIDGGTGSSSNGGVIKRADARQQMTGAEFKFREDVTKKLAITGAFTGRQRQNLRTLYDYNAVVGALNAAYRATSKLALTAKLYVRADQVDENLSFFPGLDRTAGASAGSASVNTHQMDKNEVRAEFIANFRPVEKLNLKGAYKIEVTNRRDAPSQFYAGNQYYAGGFFVGGAPNNEVAHNDVKHTLTLGAKAELPLGIEADLQAKKMKANRPAFVNMANQSDEANLTVTVPLPKNVSVYVLGGYAAEQNDVHFTNYSEVKNTYRAGLDWTGSDKASFGADYTLESIRYDNELFLGNGVATPALVGVGTSFHAATETRMINKVYGVHGRVVCPKGFVVTGQGSYTNSTVQTPIFYVFASGADYTNDYSPSNVNIARGSVAVEYTPEKFKDLTARASYAISDWVDRYDELNSGRSSIAQEGASMKF
ncbi:MAG: hypothetical protein ABL955_06640 [Elusimicrobiota bacterium]